MFAIYEFLFLCRRKMFCKLQAIVVAFSPKENGSQGRSVDFVGRGFRFSGLKYLGLENGKLFLIPRGKTRTSKRLEPFRKLCEEGC